MEAALAVIGTGSPSWDVRGSQLVDPARRRRVGLTLAAATVVAFVSVANALTPSVDAASRSATTTTTKPKTTTTTTTTVPAPVIALAQFPVQGPCAFIDTYGAPRGDGRKHEGVDIIARSGLYVYAAQDGVLTKKYLDAPRSLAGNGWRLTAADGTYFFYGHMSAFGDGLSVGSTVVAGQIIGYVGATGNAGTPHVHFEIHPGGGSSINPTRSVRAIDGCKITTPPSPALVAPSAPVLGDSTTTTVTTTPPATTTAPPKSTPPALPVAATPGGLAQDATLRWQFIEPTAVLTATPPTALLAHVTKRVTVAGVTGISKTSSAVIVRISVTSAQAASVLVHPCDSAAPLATTLFVEPGTMAIGNATVSLTSGQLCVTSSARALARITVVAQLSTTGVGVAPIITRRALDTRMTTTLTPHKVVTLSPQMLGSQAGIQAIAATFTLLDAKLAGTLLITPCGGTELKAPFNAGRITSFSVAIRANDTGLCVMSSVATNLIVDVDAVWSPQAPGFFATTPVRLFDSRETRVPASSTPRTIQVGSLVGGPATVVAVQANLTLLGGSKSASVFVWPCAQPQPESSIAVVSARTRASFSVITSVSNGAFCIASNAPVDVVVDIVGVG